MPSAPKLIAPPPSLLRNASTFLSASVVTSALALCILPVLIAQLPPDDYAIIGLIQSAQPVLALLVTAGVVQLTGVYYFENKGDNGERNHLSATFTFLSIASPIVLVLAVLAAFSYAGVIRDAVLAGSLLVFARSHVLALEGYHRARGNARRIATARVSRSATFLVGSLVAVLVVDAGLKGVLMSFVLSELLALAVLDGGELIVYRQFHLDSLRYIGAAIGFALPLIIHTAALLLLVYADRWIIGRLLSLREVGVYTVAYQIGGIVGMSAIAVNEAVSPKFLRKFQCDGADGLSAAYRKYGPAFVLTALFTAVPVLAVAAWYFHYAAPADYVSGFGPTVPVIAGMVLHAAYLPYITVLLAYRKSAVIATLSGSAALVNIVLNFVLVPLLGIMGAGIVTFLSYGILLLGFRHACSKLLPLRGGYRETLEWGFQKVLRRT